MKYARFIDLTKIPEKDKDKMVKGILWYVGRDKKKPIPKIYIETFSMLMLNVMEAVTVNEICSHMFTHKTSKTETSIHDWVFKNLDRVKILS